MFTPADFAAYLRGPAPGHLPASRRCGAVLPAVALSPCAPGRRAQVTGAPGCPARALAPAEYRRQSRAARPVRDRGPGGRCGAGGAGGDGHRGLCLGGHGWQLAARPEYRRSGALRGRHPGRGRLAPLPATGEAGHGASGDDRGPQGGAQARRCPVPGREFLDDRHSVTGKLSRRLAVTRPKECSAWRWRPLRCSRSPKSGACRSPRPSASATLSPTWSGTLNSTGRRSPAGLVTLYQAAVSALQAGPPDTGTSCFRGGPTVPGFGEQGRGILRR